MLTQIEKRELIVRTMNENPGMNCSRIAKKLKFPHRSVYRVIEKFKETLSVEVQAGRGRKSGFVNKKLARKVVAQFSRNPSTSGRHLAKKLGCSESHIRKIRKHFKLKAFRVQRVPHRDEKQNKTAKSRARKLYDGPLKTLRKNGGCLYMDDETYSKYSFRQLPGRNYYVAKVRGKVLPRYKYIQCDKFAKKAMIWQAICTCGKRSSSYITMSTMKTENYLNECLKKRLLPLIRQHDTPGVFWPDLASVHYSHRVTDWLESEGIEYVKKSCNPPNCPELRPIERFWAQIKRILQKSGSAVSTMPNLKHRWDIEVKKAGSGLVRNLMGHVQGKVRNFFRLGNN